MNRLLFVVPVLMVAIILPTFGQGLSMQETLRIDPADTVVKLAQDFVVAGSLTILHGSDTLRESIDYTADNRFGTVHPTQSFRERLQNDTTLPRELTAHYRYRLLDLRDEYYRRRLVTLVDSTGEEREVAQERTELTATSIFGKDFQRSGSLVRGFTIGSNRDLTVQSGLRLQFSGNITDDVEVLGALTDEQLPIQPEGNTQTLREIDNIFIEFRSPYVGSTIGKFSAANTDGTYTAFSRRLQGVKAVGRYGPYGHTEAVVAVSPGKFRTQQIQGRERDQGPYRLTGPSGERDIIVVAGTEKVYVDGVVMVRGETNDYVIDYSTAEIFFQTRRPITSSSRIVVDFEYTDRQYSRTFLAVANTGYLFDSTLSVTADFVRESDNQDAPIDLTLSDEDRRLLADAGADRTAAVRSGVTLVGRSDTIVGTYRRIDTVINGRPDSIFVYDPNSSEAVYSVTFSLAPNSRGDYRNVAFGQYEFVGKGNGRYLPVVYLPLPELRQVGAVKLGVRPARDVILSGEVAFSNASLNRFSTDPAANLNGLAFNSELGFRRDTLLVGGADIGALSITGRASYINERFRTVERIGSVEFDRKWNTTSRPGEGLSNDFLAEDSLRYRPISRLDLTASHGYLRRDDVFSSLRQLYSVRFAGDTLLPSADYTFEGIATEDTAGNGTDGEWLKQTGGVSYPIGPVTPGARFRTEQRRAVSTSADTLLAGSFRFVEAGPDLTLLLPFMQTTAEARFRTEDSLRHDPSIGVSTFLRDNISQTYTLRGELRGVTGLSSTLDLTYRDKRFDSVPGIAQTSRLNSITILTRSHTRWNGFDRGIDLDALYEVQTEQAARIQRVFVRVPFGQGSYVWRDLDSNGIQSEDEFFLTNAEDGEFERFDLPTEELFPIIDLRASARIHLRPENIPGAGAFLGGLLHPISSETFIRLEEKSRREDESDIYLLNLSAFQDDSTTIVGNSIIQQDIHFFESNPEYSFRLRYLERRSLTRLVQTVERSRAIERSLRIRWQPTFDIGLQLDLGADDASLLSSDILSTRTYDLTTLNAASDFSYRPERSLELGWKFRIAAGEDILPATPRTTDLTSNELRAIYSIETRGRLRATLERTVAEGENLGETTFNLPYQLTDGYGIGTTWVARATFEYRIGANLQASFTYTGRAQPPSNRVLHTGQAEIRAFF